MRRSRLGPVHLSHIPQIVLQYRSYSVKEIYDFNTRQASLRELSLGYSGCHPKAGHGTIRARTGTEMACVDTNLDGRMDTASGYFMRVEQKQNGWETWDMIAKMPVFSVLNIV